jgi:hypothetical protein
MTHSENLFDKSPETLARERAIGLLETSLAERGIPISRATFEGPNEVMVFPFVLYGWKVEAIDNFGRTFRTAAVVKI